MNFSLVNVYQTVSDLHKQGISAFIVPKTVAGVSLGKKEEKLGIKASSTCQLILEDVLLGADHLLGKEGDGFKIAMVSCFACVYLTSARFFLSVFVFF